MNIWLRLTYYWLLINIWSLECTIGYQYTFGHGDILLVINTHMNTVTYYWPSIHIWARWHTTGNQ